jgi:predicted phage terminase large subunit-like protein
LQLSPQEAARKLQERRAARKSLLDYIGYINPVYQPADHHRQIAEAVEAVVNRDLDRLIITIPPRHGKSEIASRGLPSWYVGRFPDRQIIAASYNSELAGDFGREVRNTIDSQEFNAIFPGVALRQDSKAANRWHTNKGGSYIAAGVGSGITGRGADLGLIDDPFKDREEADSEVIRDKVWKWYTSTFYTRLMPKAGIILIQTRWHDDDLAGRLLNFKGGDNWHVVSLRAIDFLPDGSEQALWPEWYDIEALNRIKSVLPPRDWNALYQQDPIPETGDYFEAQDVQWYEPPQLPKHLVKHGASDYAVTEDGGDFTEHGVAGVDKNDDLYLIDWYYGQEKTNVWIEEQLDLIDKHKPNTWTGEAGVIEKAVSPFLNKRMRERRTYCKMQWLPSVKDKPTRARSIQGRVAMGKVFLPRGKEWAERLYKQMLRFPAGSIDDGIDVLSLFGRILDKTWAAREPEAIKSTMPQDDYKPIGEEEGESWRT